MIAADDEDISRPKPTPVNFEKMSVAELQHHIAHLQSEIARAEEMIKSKLSVRNSAESLFKKG